MNQPQPVKDASPLYEVERRAHHAERPGFRITELQLHDAKAGARGVLGSTLDFVKLTGVLDWLRLVHDGLPPIIRPLACRA